MSSFGGDATSCLPHEALPVAYQVPWCGLEYQLKETVHRASRISGHLQELWGGGNQTSLWSTSIH